jgi:hypothetical protein
MEPFTTMHITMQAGKFDHPNRLFGSIIKTWQVVTSKVNDYRELIPEFFTLPDFLVNADNFDFGLPESDVELPKWSKNPMDFIVKHRNALESEHVGQHLPDWIDLVFGYKQTGKAACDSDNIFHPDSYETALRDDLSPERFAQIQNHAGSFGIIPRQLFTVPHPRRLPIPQMNRVLEFVPYYRSQTEILFLSSGRQLVYFMSGDGLFHRIRRGQLDSEWQIPPGFGFGAKSAVFPVTNFVVLTSPSGDSIHLFHIEATLTHIHSFRQQFSDLTSLTSGGRRILVVLSRDGTLFVWNFGTQECLYQVNYHLASAVDAAACETLRMVASLDSSRRVVLIELWSGSFLRSFNLIDNGAVPARLMLLEDGYIVALSECRAGNEEQTIIQVYGINTNLLGVYDKDRKSTAWWGIARISKPAMIAVAFADGSFVLLATPDAQVFASLTFADPITQIAFDPTDNMLYLVDENQQIMTALVDI